MSNPPRHFTPQTRRAQLRVVQAINSAERAMIPPGFDAEAAAVESLHFTSLATPLVHDAGPVTRLQQQVNKAEAQAEQRRAVRAITTPGTPSEGWESASRLLQRRQSMTADPYRLDTGIPQLRPVGAWPTPARKPTEAAPHDTLAERLEREYEQLSREARREFALLVAVYGAAIAFLVGVTVWFRV